MAGLFLSIIIIVMVSCSTNTRYKTLSFFFDGVPDPNDQIATVSDSVSVDSASTGNLAPKKLPFVLHPPYRERACEACHNIRKSNKLVESQLSLCYQCHEDFADTYEILHGPTASGGCTQCHNPHRTKNEKLLNRTGQQLCLYCHSLTNIQKNDIHLDIEDTDCTECHNPHGGEDRTFMN